MRDILPINNNGSIQLKFSFGGKRHSFNPIPGGVYGNRRDMAQAQAIATRIQNDILSGYFDASLDRYRLNPKKATPTATAKPSTTLAIWDAFVDSLDLPSATKADHYEMIRRMLLKAEPKLSDVSWITSAKLAPSTYNKRLSYVKKCFTWAVEEGLTDANPYDKLKPKKAIAQDIKPFSTEEISRIIAGFEAQAPHYVPFVKFLFFTGVRLSEAIGLRWENVDFSRDEIVIRESLSKDRTSNGYNRIRKETKTGSVRYLTMSSELRELLRTLMSTGNDLVFTTVRGFVIDSGNFRELWQQVLADCGVPYRKPHAIRHTLLSHAVEQGIPLTGVAYLAGHANTRMVMQTYGHLINRPSLPVFNLGDH
jgi:integrase